MKKKKIRLFLLFCLMCVLTVIVVACAKKTSGEEDKKHETKQEEYGDASKNQFDAEILEVQKEYIMVNALEGQTIAGEVRVNTGLLKSDEISSLKKGDVVRITHDGKMTMSIPPQMTAVDICKVSLEN